MEISACRGEFHGDIYESFGEIRAKYFFHNICGDEALLLMPYLPRGIISGFSVVCDGKEFAGAKAVNIREISDMPEDCFIALENRCEGLFVLRIKGVLAECLEVNVAVCQPLSRHGQYLSLGFSSPAGLGEKCPLTVDFTVYGKVRKAVCPNHTVMETAEDGFYRIFVDKIFAQFALYIFFADLPENRIIISRQGLEKNIALCSFVPRLEKISAKARRFDIHISFIQGDRLEIIGQLATFLRCLGERDSFRLSIGGKSLEFMSAVRENIDFALEFACGRHIDADFDIPLGDWNTVIICSGAVFDPETALSGTALVILSGELPPRDFCKNMLFVGKGEGEFSVPAEFSAVYDKRLASAILEPLGGVEVEFLQTTDVITANSVHQCFALHDIFPPMGVRVLSKSRRLVEEISFDKVETYPSVRAIDVMYWRAIAEKKRSAEVSAEKRCLVRQEVNEICLKNRIPVGDIALVCVGNGQQLGLLSALPQENVLDKKHFREGDEIEASLVIDLILKSQTADGVIADIAVFRPDQLVFSTAVCLIALYLSTGEQYASFAKRSLEFLKDKEGFWVKTALDMWNREEIDPVLLDEKLEMKIMCQQLHELALLIIKNHRRK